jgi:hypothetical protein
MTANVSSFRRSELVLLPLSALAREAQRRVWVVDRRSSQ